MTQRESTRSNTLTRSPTATRLVLLFLIWHAFVATATHFHRDVRPGAAATIAGLSVGQDDGAEQPNAATSHAQCLLCRLQRNFLCDLEQGIPATLAPPADNLGGAILTTSIYSRTSFLKPTGRAPPTA